MGLINYVKTMWNTKSFVNSTNLNHIEDGIGNATEAVNELTLVKHRDFETRAELNAAIAAGEMHEGQTYSINDGNSENLNATQVAYSGSVQASNVKAAIDTLNSDLANVAKKRSLYSPNNDFDNPSANIVWMTTYGDSYKGTPPVDNYGHFLIIYDGECNAIAVKTQGTPLGIWARHRDFSGVAWTNWTKIV